MIIEFLETALNTPKSSFIYTGKQTIPTIQLSKVHLPHYFSIT